NQPTSVHRADGLELKNCYVTTCVRCAPPHNKPSTQERDNCLKYLIEELRLLKQVQVIVCLGKFAWEGVLRALRLQGHIAYRKPSFGHGRRIEVGPYTLIGSYHPSQQNTFTGKLTRPMLDRVIALAVLHSQDISGRHEWREAT